MLNRPRHVVDCHVHIMTPRRIRGGIRWVRRVVPEYENLSLDVTAEELAGHLKGAGAEAFFNYFYPLAPGESRGINRWNSEMAGRHEGFIAFASLHPGDGDRRGIITEALEDLALAGFKFHPYIQQFDILDSRMDGVYERLQESGRPVVFHTGFAVFYGLPSIAKDFFELLRRYPAMKILAAHMLCPDLKLERWEEILGLYPNLYLDATNTFALCPPGSAEREVMRDFIARFSGRMLFGTDYPMGMTYPVGLLYDQAFEICPGQAAVEDLFWRTASKIINIRGISE